MCRLMRNRQAKHRHSAMKNDVTVTADLLRRYDRPGPRYTSYPTAPEWSQEFTGVDYKTALLRSRGNDEAGGLALYVHIPFCNERCLYCGCNVVISKKPEIVGKFLDYMVKELNLLSSNLDSGRRLVQLHFGGGTPTYLSPHQIRWLTTIIFEHFEVDSKAEVAVEVDPRVTTKEHLEALRSSGFNRISMGVQDLDSEVQRIIGRNQSLEETRRCFDWCRELGFAGINIDLIYGLPGQKLESWIRTLKNVIEMAPDRLAVYSFAYLPERLKHQARMGQAELPSTQEKYALLAATRRLFGDAGYRSIGMDHFAKPEDELSVALDAGRPNRNFMGYTPISEMDMIGIGPSAISRIAGVYAQNEKRLFKYYRILDEGTLPTVTGCNLSFDDRVRGWTIQQLMCNFCVSFSEFEERFGVPFLKYYSREVDGLQEYIEQGFVRLTESGILLTPLGQPFVRNVAMIFDAYLKSVKEEQKFSRTI